MVDVLKASIIFLTSILYYLLSSLVLNRTKLINPKVTNRGYVDGLFLRGVGGNSNSGVCRTCHGK
jgi:hypothetical protein